MEPQTNTPSTPPENTPEPPVPAPAPPAPVPEAPVPAPVLMVSTATPEANKDTSANSQQPPDIIMQEIGSSTHKPSGAYLVLLVGGAMLLIGIAFALVAASKQKIDIDFDALKVDRPNTTKQDSEVTYQEDQPQASTQNDYADETRKYDTESVLLVFSDYVIKNNGKPPTVEQLDAQMKGQYLGSEYTVVNKTPAPGEIQYAVNSRCYGEGELNMGYSNREAAFRVLLTDNKTLFCMDMNSY